ncbi:putative glycosyltransferase [Sulfolobales Beppu filamentous virus 2]|uniref:Putative glycosyltransferase n=1 Tax=Sulfolobales Beppu filamentous virus 2 TaxID=2493123 RepID=A0A3S8NEY4_9VIRU|nr:putative glycosyltransferase [Sulfolobales Beppu filamentous virus 2]AZI75790.1 putative glycosyltransferase [Sulfolobales Beppu filamentous virus 2]
MNIAFVFHPSRRAFSFWYQYDLLHRGLEQHGVKVKLFDTFTKRLRDYDVLIWWVPFRTVEFERLAVKPLRYTKIQIFYNPIDTNEISDFVVERVKNFADIVLTASIHNYKLWKEYGFRVIKVPHAIDPDLLPEECELNENLYYFEARTFPVRRGADIAMQIANRLGLKVHLFYEFSPNLTDHLRKMCRAGNYLAPVRGGEFEIQVLEALVMGMKVYYSKREIFDYIKDYKPTFPINGEYCNTEFLGDIYQVGCYDNVEPVDSLPDLPRPHSEYYKKEYNYINTAKVFLEEIDRDDM